MNKLLTEKTEVVAYFLWEETGNNNALHQWYCAEDIACFLEDCAIFTPDDIKRIMDRGPQDLGYIEFVRHIAFRIYVYTDDQGAATNWFAAERLLANREWCACATELASIYHAEKEHSSFIRAIRSSKVRGFYDGKGNTPLL